MSSKKRKHLKAQFEALTRPQLVALAVQKEVIPYAIAIGMSQAALVESLIVVEGVLKPVPANVSERPEVEPECDGECEGCTCEAAE
jgi:hypothetical protein